MSGMMNERFVRTHVAALMDTMVEWQADVIVDFWNPLACMAARALRKPLVTVIQADMHPDSQGFIWWQDPSPDIPSPVPAINPVLATHNLEPVNSTSELCLGDLTLVLGTPETDPLPDGADVTYVGPILWQNPEARLPDWVSELRRDRPVVWVYSGNPQYMPGIRTPVDSAIILESCIAALADKEVQVVLTTGHHALPKRLLPLPANFRYEDYVPGLAMAERSDLLVHHGGYGSCQTGLYTGTPAVIIPTFSERESNARRIAAAGAGKYLVPGEGKSWRKVVQPQALWAKIEQVLSDPAYKANAVRIREKLRTYGGASGVADRVEAFCQLSTQLPQP
jgi:UDP:flavonoid glycosyltransferase YjiC (YdhE family)